MLQPNLTHQFSRLYTSTHSTCSACYQAMQSNSAAGSFLDEVVKWQKRLQTIEAVLSTWLEVQEKWVELEEVRCRASGFLFFRIRGINYDLQYEN